MAEEETRNCAGYIMQPLRARMLCFICDSSGAACLGSAQYCETLTGCILSAFTAHQWLAVKPAPPSCVGCLGWHKFLRNLDPIRQQHLHSQPMLSVLLLQRHHEQRCLFASTHKYPPLCKSPCCQG